MAVVEDMGILTEEKQTEDRELREEGGEGGGRGGGVNPEDQLGEGDVRPIIPPPPLPPQTDKKRKGTCGYTFEQVNIDYRYFFFNFVSGIRADLLLRIFSK